MSKNSIIDNQVEMKDYYLSIEDNLWTKEENDDFRNAWIRQVMNKSTVPIIRDVDYILVLNENSINI